MEECFCRSRRKSRRHCRDVCTLRSEDQNRDVVGEIAEFAYYDDERLFLAQSAQPVARGEISAGRLWHTQREWAWRIWSISRTGDIAFSESTLGRVGGDQRATQGFREIEPEDRERL